MFGNSAFLQTPNKSRRLKGNYLTDRPTAAAAEIQAGNRRKR
jgi:hypothetical protein